MTNYSLGTEDPEIKRLDQQASWLEPASRMMLRAAGIAPGMRVLDLGCGLGHLSFIAADLAGPDGRVVGLDKSPRLREIAGARAAAHPQVRFVEGDARSWRGDQQFDAVIGRLILCHLPDPVAVLRHHIAALRPGGLVVVLDFDVSAARVDPPVPLVEVNAARVIATFKKVGADPTIGIRLGALLRDAGVAEVTSFGYQDYLGPTDPRGPAMLAAVVQTLAPHIIGLGIATADELGLDTLAERLAAAVREAGSMFLPPTLVGAWGRIR